MQLPFVNETELVMDVLRHGGQVRVMGPDTLRAAVTEQLRAGLDANKARPPTR
jgi:predicted DNA-binding transcriptional regulator YafY